VSCASGVADSPIKNQLRLSPGQSLTEFHAHNRCSCCCLRRPLALTDRSFHAAHSCLPVWVPESAAAKIPSVEPRLKASFSRASGALQRALSDKVHATTLDSKAFQGSIEGCCHHY
jgi:hypothetical protein